MRIVFAKFGSLIGMNKLSSRGFYICICIYIIIHNNFNIFTHIYMSSQYTTEVSRIHTECLRRVDFLRLFIADDPLFEIMTFKSFIKENFVLHLRGVFDNDI